MQEQHRRAIDDLRNRFGSDEAILALLVIGSVARGDARADSDVDCCFVVTDDEFRGRESAGELSIRVAAPADWPRGQVGGGIVDFGYLSEAAERGPEPARYAFQDAIVVFTHDPAIPALVRRIPFYQEHERLEKMRSFASQLPVHLSYLHLAEYSRNSWLLAQTATELVLFAGRLVLAHNRILFPNRKQFMRVLATAPEKPDGMVELADRLMAAPSIALAQEFHDLVVGFAEWPAPPEGHWSRFSRDRETNWRTGPPALADS